ncbi:MAG: superoxide dismutase, Ni [Candidatus Woesebacteria bacterium]|jgi:nickel superoxide dismutase
MKLFKFIKPVYAHCDVPCGIYETDTMRHAADTCMRMVEKIQSAGDLGKDEARNNCIRSVMTKEKHAQLCKDQLYLLWSDYFKPQHLEQFSDLHERFWQATKQCSKVKQTVSKEECQILIDQVAGIAEMFKQSQS